MPKAKTQKTKIVLFDAHAIIHRAYHALPDFSSSSGEPTGALYGLSSMLMAIIKEFEPDQMVAAFDLPKPTYRHEAYADYKSGRKALDDNLGIQLSRSRDVFKAFGVPIYDAEGFEADDIIGTAVEQLAKDKNNEIIIASGDMDTLQLVKGKQVKVFTLRKGIKDTIVYDEKAVKDRFGFKPELLVDYKGLRGDASDNIIGIPGIGEKTATTLIIQFGGIEKMYKEVEKISKKLEKKKPIDGAQDKEEGVDKKDLENTVFAKIKITPRIFNLLKDNKEEAEFSKMLATIRRDAPVKIVLEKESWKDDIPLKNIKELFRELDFRTLSERLESVFGVGSEINNKEADQEKEKKEVDIDEQDLAETAVALWVIDSNMTNPTIQDILHFAKTDDFQKAKDFIFKKLEKENLKEIFETIEKPLIPIVAEMKVNGIVIDKKVLSELSKEYHKKLKILEKEIHKLSGDDEFNIASPKQLAEVLFTKMELKYKGMRKTSSGSYSTKEDVLNKLVEVHPIAEKILEYRELAKLLGTYIDKIPELVGKDNRIHPTFLQAGSRTGRMASQDPGIQNIPVKTELGRRIRNAFVAPKGKSLLALDYSQIELRLAAMLSEDEKLLQTFREGKDVHSSVAMHVFGVKAEDVDKAMRVKAKTINFGVLYGMGVSALQKNLKTDRKEAQKFYDDYFNTFSTLAKYLEETKAFAAKNGYVETMFGRKRHFEGINSSLPFIRAQAERMAINAPIQGTSADITKLAMVRVSEFLKKEKLDDRVKMIIQVHDELIFEVDHDLVEEVSGKIKKIMEGILTEEQSKGIPTVVDSSFGPSWGEFKSI